jgi:hypothetical protein
MTHIVEDCLLTKLEGSLKALHNADNEAVTYLGNKLQMKHKPIVINPRTNNPKDPYKGQGRSSSRSRKVKF